jgi:hypothetical protein
LAITDAFPVTRAVRAAPEPALPQRPASGFWQRGLLDPGPAPPSPSVHDRGTGSKPLRLGPKGGRLGRPPGAKGGCLPEPVKLPHKLPMVVDYPTACALAGGVSHGTIRNLVISGRLASVKLGTRRLICVDGPNGLRDILTAK